MLYTIDAGDLGEITVEVEYNYTPGEPGFISGPPENCYPPEPEEIEITNVRLVNPESIMLTIAEYLSESDSFADEVRAIEADKNLPQED